MYSFDIISNIDGRQDVLLFDEKTATLFDINHNPIPVSGYNKDNSIVIRISLGTECNNKCIYCQQHMVCKSHLTDNFEETAERFVSNLYTFIANRFSDVTDRNIAVSFWGGEPLLYIDRIKVLIPLLRMVFGNLNFFIITNGILLSDDITSFLIDNGVYTNISHDGPGQKICRNVEILDNNDTRANILRLIDAGLLSFSPVFTVHNPTIRNWMWYMYNYLGDKIYKVNGVSTMYIRPVTEDHSKLLPSPVHIQQNTDDIIACIRRTDLAVAPFAKEVNNNIWQMLEVLHTHSPLYPYCNSSKPNVISVDVIGNVWKCHNFIDPANTSNIAGNIFTDVHIDKDWVSHKTDVCNDCLCQLICHAGCPLEGCHTNTCWYRYHTLLPMFYMAIDVLTGGEYTLLNIRHIGSKYGQDMDSDGQQ